MRKQKKKNEELDTEIDSKIRKYQDIIKKEFIYFKRDYTVLANARQKDLKEKVLKYCAEFCAKYVQSQQKRYLANVN